MLLGRLEKEKDFQKTNKYINSYFFKITTMSIILTDPRDLMEFVSRVNAYTNEIYAEFRVSRTAHLADLYRKSDSDLIKELSEVENYYENLLLI